MIAYHNGHAIWFDAEINSWKYVSDNTKLDKDRMRACPMCGKSPNHKGHDYCVSDLPHVANACCGHKISKCYAVLENGKRIEAKDSIELKQKILVEVKNGNF